jgi:hypothetical protein
VASPYADAETGTYGAVPQSTPITFSGFVFNPPAASITPLWTFQIGGTVYSFDATIDSSFFNSTLDEWDIGGQGMAMVTGYTPTAGTWNVNLSQSGASFVFDSSAAAASNLWSAAPRCAVALSKLHRTWLHGHPFRQTQFRLVAP